MTNRDHRHITRRHKLNCAANRMRKTRNPEEAWFSLAERLDTLSAKDIPRFDDLYRAIRGATIVGAHKEVS